MPWARRQVRYLLSKFSPLSAPQKNKMKAELHADPSLGHKRKGLPDSEEKLLTEIRERYRYAAQQWRKIREEAARDMKFVLGDPWDDETKRSRKEAQRPLISPDEINQYLHQAMGSFRQNKRGIKINPAGGDATAQTAEAHENLIRGIEYRSNAQRSAYIPAFERMLQSSYSFFRISRQYCSERSFEQEIRIKGITNPDCVLYDPDCREADWSDAEYVFVFEPVRIEDFKRRYPRAKADGFTSDELAELSDWIREDHVVIAEYWRATKEERELLMVDSPQGTMTLYRDELPADAKVEVLKSRLCEVRRVVQYLTNGYEILEPPQEEPSSIIPIVPVVGKEVWINEHGRAERHLLSMVRLARDPQLMYSYLCSQEAEEAKMSPKSPFLGYYGQFESDRDAWETVSEVPHGFLQADPVVDQATGQVLPLPTRPQFQPNFQAYEIAKESYRRAIMSAMGITPLPTAAQRRNEKSGVALERIQAQEALGSFHFVDNFDRALELAGRIIEQMIPVVYDTERDVPFRGTDDAHRVVRINTHAPYPGERGEPEHYPMDVGIHDVTVSVGPSYQSQHEAVADFLDQLVKMLPQLPPPSSPAAKLLAMAIRMRNLGPQGEEMADIISPDEQQPLPPQAMEAINNLQQQLLAINAYAQQKENELAQMMQEKQAKIVDNEYRMAVERLKAETSVLVAEINTKAQEMNERMALFGDMVRQLNIHLQDLVARNQAAQPAAEAPPTVA
jgi:hypothetical protein